jgi:hypothetical protein
MMTMLRSHLGRLSRAVLLGPLLGIGVANPAVSRGVAQPVRGHSVEGLGVFRAGVLRLKLDDLNARLEGAGYPHLDATVPVWGGGGYGRVGDFLLGLELHGGLDPSAAAGPRRTSLKGGYGLTRARYVMPSLGGLTLYPAAGVGAGGLWLQIAEPGAPDFDDVLDNPLRGATLSTGIHLLLDLGVGLEYRIRATSGEGGRAGGVLLGAEAGYVFAPGDTSWGLDGLAEARDGPKLGIEGFYLWFSLGGWGRGGSSGDAASSSRPASAGDGRNSR